MWIDVLHSLQLQEYSWLASLMFCVEEMENVGERLKMGQPREVVNRHTRRDIKKRKKKR